MQKDKARLKRERRAARYGVTVAQWYQMPKAEREALKAKAKVEREQRQEERLDLQHLSTLDHL